MKNSETSGEKDLLHQAKRRCEDRDREDVVDAGQHGIDTSDTEDDDDDYMIHLKFEFELTNKP